MTGTQVFSTNRILGQEFTKLLFRQVAAVGCLAALLLTFFSGLQRWQVLKNSLAVSANIVSKSLELQDWDLIEHHLQNLTETSAVEKIEFVGPVTVGRLMGPTGDPKFGYALACTQASVPSHPFTIKGCTRLLGLQEIVNLMIFIGLYIFACGAVFLLFRKSLEKTLGELQQEIDDVSSTIGNQNTQVAKSVSRLPEFREIRGEAPELNFRRPGAERNRSLALVAAQISHDLRGPLSGISIALDHFDKNPQDSLRLIRESYQGLNELSAEMRSQYLGKKQTEVVPSNHAGTTDIVPLVSRFLEQKRLALGGSVNIRDAVKVPSASVPLKPLVFSRILENLFNNALDAALPETCPEISFELGDAGAGYFVLRACDQGRGIAQEHLEKIFDQGFSFGKEGGSGLGLDFVKVSLEAVGGQISAQSNPQIGTVFSLHIPKADAQGAV